MYAKLERIEYFLPKNILDNEQIHRDFPDWSPDKIARKIGIERRHIASDDECSSDLACEAVQKLFDSGAITPGEVDFVILCTQTPDYILPTTACLLQYRLGITKNTGALDINLGCSGYVYGLGLAKGLVETGQASNVLLVTADTYSKLILESDMSTRTLFGDAAAATIIRGHSDGYNQGAFIGDFVYGTDGSGHKNLIVQNLGMRNHGNHRLKDQEIGLYMNGPQLFAFTLERVPKLIKDVLRKNRSSLEEVSLVIFHQANLYMLEQLAKRIRIPKDKLHISMKDCGNTVSSSIPIALKTAMDTGLTGSNNKVVLIGFGVGYSWAGTIIQF